MASEGNKIVGFKLSTLLMTALSVFMVCSPRLAFGQSATQNLVVPGTAISQGSGSRALLAAEAMAKQDAAKFAWNKLRAQPQFSTEAMRFTIEQNAAMASAILELCNFLKLDQVSDKPTKTVTMRFNIECPTQDLTSRIGELKASFEAERASGFDAGNSEQMVYLFLSRRLSAMQSGYNDAGSYRASEKSFQLISSQALADGLVGRINSVGLNAVSYSDLVGAGCSSIDISEINTEFSSTPPGQGDYGLTDDTRRQIIAAVRKCGVKYLALGAADVGVTGIDPSSGLPLGRVVVSAQVLDIRQMLPVAIARVRTVVDETGGDENAAEELAVAKASAEVGVKLVEQIKVRGVR
jgi:hypothetical protein